MSGLVVRRGWTDDTDADAAVRHLAEQLDGPASLTLVFASSTYDLDRLGSAIGRAFDGPILACTTAGELTPEGFRRNCVTAVSLASPALLVRTDFIDDVREFGPKRAAEVGERVRRWVTDSQVRLPEGRTAGLLLIDGLSNAEEAVVGHLGNTIGAFPIVGGSAGDDGIDQGTYVYHEGRFVSDAAVFATMLTTHAFRPIKFQHFKPSEKRLVITAADPSERLVFEIDGEPAAEAYGRAIGVPLEALDDLAFSSNPLILRVGGEPYVRSVQRVEPGTKHLRFHSAIDEGLVLTIGQAQDIVATTEQSLTEADAAVGGAKVIVGFECLHRRLEYERRGLRAAADDITKRFNVIGFHTYGEQFGTIHINHTFTGLALGD